MVHISSRSIELAQAVYKYNYEPYILRSSILLLIQSSPNSLPCLYHIKSVSNIATGKGTWNEWMWQVNVLVFRMWASCWSEAICYNLWAILRNSCFSDIHAVSLSVMHNYYNNPLYGSDCNKHSFNKTFLMTIQVYLTRISGISKCQSLLWQCLSFSDLHNIFFRNYNYLACCMGILMLELQYFLVSFSWVFMQLLVCSS